MFPIALRGYNPQVGKYSYTMTKKQDLGWIYANKD